MAKLTQQIREEILSITNPAVRRKWEIFYSIPEDLQNAMFDPPVAETIWDIINEKYKLEEKNVSRVAKIIGLIFLGELPIKNFISALQKDLNIDVKTAQDIAQDINQAIFQPVRQSLMAVHGLTPTNADKNAIPVPEPESRSGFPIKSGMTNNQKTITEPRHQVQYQQPRQTQPMQSDDYEAKRRREEVLNKIKQPPARPATFFRMIPNKNVVNLRVLAKKKHYKKSEYDGFFSA